jgi:predicted dehydrogenase
MSEKKLRFGIIGVGGIAQGHIERLARNPRAEIVAICDPSEKSIAATQEKQGAAVAKASVHSDYRKLLDESKPDAVVICSRHCDHFDQIIDSLDAGAHVLTEKPLVNRVSDAYAVLRKAESSGKVVGIAYQRHTDPHFRYIRKAIASGEFGKVQAIAALQQQGWRAGTVGSWRQDPAASGGGQLHDSGSHLVDIILWTTGLTAETVSARIDFRGAPVDINSALAVQFREGAIGTLTVIGDAKGWYEDITIWCDNGTFYVRNHDSFSVQNPDGKIVKPDLQALPRGSDVNTNFIAAIYGEEEIGAPAICGLRVMELTEAAWRSGEVGGQAITVEHAG